MPPPGLAALSPMSRGERVSEDSVFGVRLARLLRHWRMGVGHLSRITGVSERELEAVLNGATPRSSLIRRLAPALNFHAADLFAVAGLAVPDHLSYWDDRAGSAIEELVTQAMRLRPDGLGLLRRHVRAVPRQRRTTPSALPSPAQYGTSSGASIVRMLHNRNLDWLNSARVLFRLTGVGPLSAATIGAVGYGSTELTPDLLTGLSIVLAIRADDLAALGGLELAQRTPPVDPRVSEVAELIWEVRDLTVDQLRRVCDQVRSGACADVA